MVNSVLPSSTEAILMPYLLPVNGTAQVGTSHLELNLTGFLKKRKNLCLKINDLHINRLGICHFERLTREFLKNYKTLQTKNVNIC
jgi:hypothetical protein